MVAFGDRLDPVAHCADHSSSFVAEHGWQRVRCRARDDVPVAVTDAARRQANLDLAGAGLAELDLLHRHGLVELSEHGGAHNAILSRRRRYARAMKTQAAVLWEPGQPVEILEVDLAPPHGRARCSSRSPPAASARATCTWSTATCRSRCRSCSDTRRRASSSKRAPGSSRSRPAITSCLRSFLRAASAQSAGAAGRTSARWALAWLPRGRWPTERAGSARTGRCSITSTRSRRSPRTRSCRSRPRCRSAPMSRSTPSRSSAAPFSRATARS